MDTLHRKPGSAVTGLAEESGSSNPVFVMQRASMRIGFRKAFTSDAELLIDIYNSAFYRDYIRYGTCPAYGKTKEMMEQSILDYPKFLIIYDSRPVGCISCKEAWNGICEIGCLCVLPEYQGKGIGTAAVEFIKTYYRDWKQITLVTPADKEENVRFYTKKCGFDIQSVEMDGCVKVYRFVLERSVPGHKFKSAPRLRMTFSFFTAWEE